MKKVLLTLALVAAVTASYAQGTIAFPNSALTRVQQHPLTGANFNATENLNYGVFWGTTAGTLTLVPTLGTSTSANPGIIGGGATTTFAIPGTSGGDTVFIQIRGWETSFGSNWQLAEATGRWFGSTDTRQVTLAPTVGPGTVIWQTASGTNPNRFTPLIINEVPEPSSLALVGLGAAALMIFRRRS